MEDKFRMTAEQSIFVVRRNIIDYIWKSAKLEGLELTYPEIEVIIYNGICPNNVKVSDVIAVNNLKCAWDYLLDTPDSSTDFKYICQLNRIVGGDNLIIRAGFLRTAPVSIGGTAWKPEMPEEDKICRELESISQIENSTERAITLMLYCMRSQMFFDGNKRAAMLAANHEMIMNGCGIISVPIEKQPEFTKLLVEFYESGDKTELSEFVYNECIDGINF